MISLKSIGHYLDRSIIVVENYLTEDIDLSEYLNKSIVLIESDSELTYDEFIKTNNLLLTIIKCCPLTIAVWGINAEQIFDFLLLELSTMNTKKHIMTKLIQAETIEDAVDDLIIATLPSEDRFDEWKNYTIFIQNQVFGLKVVNYVKGNYPKND